MKTESGALCDVCCCDSSVTAVKAAVMFCSDCQQHLCEHCCSTHRKLQPVSTHKLTKLVNPLPSQPEHLLEHSAGVCELHKESDIEIYCTDCQVATCRLCSNEIHNSHKCLDIKEIVKTFCSNLEVDFVDITSSISQHRGVLKNREKQWNDFSEHILRTELEICERAEHLKNSIDCYKQKLIDELLVTRENTMTQVDHAKQEAEYHLSTLQNLKKLTEEMRDKEIYLASEIVREAGSLHQRTRDQLEKDVFEHKEVNIHHMTFTSSDFVIDDLDNVFGRLLNTSRKGWSFCLLKHLILCC